jgi:hypothetical protein
MKNRRDVSPLILWLQRFSPGLETLIWHGRVYQAIADALNRMADRGEEVRGSRRCPARIIFATDCPTVLVQCETRAIVRALARERSRRVSPRFFDVDKEVLWQWFCEHDELDQREISYPYPVTTTLRDEVFEVLKSGAALLECRKCLRGELRAEYSEISKGVTFVTTKSLFRCPGCHTNFFPREDKKHYCYDWEFPEEYQVGH